MKRLLLLVASIAAAAFVLVPTAAAHTVSLAADPAAPSTVQHVTLNGQLAPAGNDWEHVNVYMHKGSYICPDTWNHDGSRDDWTKTGTYDVDFGTLAAGTYRFEAYWGFNHSSCITVVVHTPTDPGLTLDMPAQATVDVPFTVDGMLWGYDDEAAVDETVDLTLREGMCEDESFDAVAGGAVATTDEDGLFTATLKAGAVGHYVVEAYNEAYDVSGCAEIEVVAAPRIPSDELVSSYLCWNQVMANPVAYIDKTADAMWKTGNYFEPLAVAGNVTEGTNIGAYHLTCNPTGLTKTDQMLGGSGEVYNALGNLLYHQEHSGGNDLNLYHIWK